MIPVAQRIAGALDASTPGDCFKCCIASILERPYDEVPHFVQQEREAKRYFVNLANEWLTAEGYPLQILYRCIVNHEKNPAQLWLDGRRGDWWPNNAGWWLAGVKSKRWEGQDHVIVMHGDQIAFDPSDLVGTPEYDERPYLYEGWHFMFVAPEPWTVGRLEERP